MLLPQVLLVSIGDAMFYQYPVVDALFILAHDVCAVVKGCGTHSAVQLQNSNLWSVGTVQCNSLLACQKNKGRLHSLSAMLHCC